VISLPSLSNMVSSISSFIMSFSSCGVVKFFNNIFLIVSRLIVVSFPLVLVSEYL